MPACFHMCKVKGALVWVKLAARGTGYIYQRLLTRGYKIRRSPNPDVRTGLATSTSGKGSVRGLVIEYFLIYLHSGI